MRPSHVFAGIPTADLASAVAWYEQLLRRPPDRYPHAEEAVWSLTDPDGNHVKIAQVLTRSGG